jgi:8-oxo-dGTP diphosphatase
MDTNIKFHQKAIVYKNDDQFLALKRANTKTWDLLGGGVQFPELHLDALRRECIEEAAIEIDDIQPLDVQTVIANDGTYLLFIGYSCQALSEEIKVSEEHTDFQWVTKEEFLALDAEDYLIDFVERVL